MGGAELTPRQKQIFDLLLTGASNKEIGYQLGITEGTVKFYTTETYRAVGVSSRHELLGRRIVELEDQLRTYQQRAATAEPMLDL